MKKGKLFLLLSLLGIALPFSFSSSSISTRAEDGEDSLNYIEETADDYYETTIRTYLDFKPIYIEEHFKAPYGCYLNLAMSEASYYTLRNEIYDLPNMEDSSYTINSGDVVVYRKLDDSLMYAYSHNTWSIDVGEFTAFIKQTIEGYRLYELDEKTVDIDLEAEIYINFSYIVNNVNVYYQFVFEIEPYHLKHYEPGDILYMESMYLFMESENRFTASARYSEDLFNQDAGFITDGRVASEWDSSYYFEKYYITFINKSNGLILDTYYSLDNEDNPSIEFYSIPKDPITIVAKISFFSNGNEYSFYSNDVVVCKKIEGLSIDGYNNRTTIGKNEKHKISLINTFDYEDITFASLDLKIDALDYQFPSHLIDIKTIYQGSERPGCITFDRVCDEFFEFEFSCSKPGVYEISAMLTIYAGKMNYYDTKITFSIAVSNEPVTYTPIDEALTLDKEGVIDCVSGGEPFTLNAHIAEDILNGGETPTYEWSASRLNVVEIISNNGAATIHPVGSGVVTVSVKCVGEIFGEIEKTIVINVINDIYSLSSISVSDEFHYSGKDLKVSLNIDRYSNLINFKPEWQVYNKDDEEVPFVEDGNLSIYIPSPTQNDYRIVALYNGIEIDSQIVEVRNVNVDQFVKDNIIWIALVTAAFMGLVIFLKSILDKKGSLVLKIEKTYKKFETIDKDDHDVVKKLNKIKLSILGDIEFAKNLNMNALNEYEKTIRYLGKSLADIKAIVKNKANMQKQEYDDLFNKLTNDLVKALNVAKEIEDARNLAYANSLKANENNIVKEDKHK